MIRRRWTISAPLTRNFIPIFPNVYRVSWGDILPKKKLNCSPIFCPKCKREAMHTLYRGKKLRGIIFECLPALPCLLIFKRLIYCHSFQIFHGIVVHWTFTRKVSRVCISYQNRSLLSRVSPYRTHLFFILSISCKYSTIPSLQNFFTCPRGHQMTM